MQSVAKSNPMNKPPNDYLRRCVCTANPPHVFGAAFGRELVRHVRHTAQFRGRSATPIP